MFQKEPAYAAFPPALDFDNQSQRTKHMWKVNNPLTLDPHGKMQKVTAAEVALNWQAEI